jgi:hypothetical protein
MKCVERKFIAVNSEDPVNFLQFEEFENISTKTDYVLIPGGHNWNFFETHTGDNVVLLYFEEPNCFTVNSELNLYSKYKHRIYKMYSICPYSTDYYNNLENNNRHKRIWMPFNIKYLPTSNEKIYDVFYSGHIRSCPFDLGFLNDFQYKCIVSFVGGTHSGVSYTEKLNLNSKSKISIVHNQLRISNGELPTRYPTHAGLALCGTHGIVPQLKNRCIEAAASKSLMLCLHDNWNLLEQQFTPDVDFIYWYNINDLMEKIKHILSNYESYTPMIESAYEKIKTRWSTKMFFDQFLKDI